MDVLGPASLVGVLADAAVQGARPRVAGAIDLGAVDPVMETVEDLFAERGAEDKVWGFMVKQALKRRKPGFNESYHGFQTFGRLPEDAWDRGLLELEYDEKSGGYNVKSYASDD